METLKQFINERIKIDNVYINPFQKNHWISLGTLHWSYNDEYGFGKDDFTSKGWYAILIQRNDEDDAIIFWSDTTDTTKIMFVKFLNDIKNNNNVWGAIDPDDTFDKVENVYKELSKHGVNDYMENNTSVWGLDDVNAPQEVMNILDNMKDIIK